MFLVRVLSLRMLLSAEVPWNYHIRHLFEQTNTYMVGGFVFASVLHPAPVFVQRRTAVFSAICMTLFFG